MRTTFSNLILACTLLSSLWLRTIADSRADIVSLSNGNSIVNIDARVHGATSFSGGGSVQSFAHVPFSSTPALTLAPGTYTFRAINSTDAGIAYPELSPSQLNSIFTAWTFNSPWTVNYMVFDNAAATNPALTQLFDGGLDPAYPSIPTGNATAAYNHALSSGYFNKIRPAPPGRAGGPSSFLNEWTFNTTTTIRFAIPDNILSDNQGGVSVLVSSAIPEPGTAMLLTLFSTLIFSRRRRVA